MCQQNIKCLNMEIRFATDVNGFTTAIAAAIVTAVQRYSVGATLFP